MRRNRNVKILATLGPASFDETVIERLFVAGADVFRINMSHADHDTMRALVQRIRNVEKKQGRPIGILCDLQGPKLRVGAFADRAVELKQGQTFTLDRNEAPGDTNRVYLPHPEIFAAVKPGDRLLIDDGRLELVIIQCDLDKIECRVVAGTKISDRKGVSLPDTLLAVGAMTEKDHRDLAAIVEEDVDWIALSFIQRPDDIAEARKIVKGRMSILSKIEKPQALLRIEEIIDQSDAIMVARGDLGVEMPLESVPGTQMRLIQACRNAGKPVVVATQMLESMISAPVPTRAEVSDVATAVYEGADAIMLSAESASGQYPIEAVQTMDRIAQKIERDIFYNGMINAQHPKPMATSADAIALATRQIAETLNLAAIVAYTTTGTTGIRTSRERPRTPIILLSPKVETARRLAIGWGLHCVVTEDAKDLDEVVDRAAKIACKEGFCKTGERIIITAGVPFGTPGSTNMLRIAFVNEDHKA
ncbi:pyruvate kinase [Bartonella sp. HY329]|uniref:pyruvate kinase n=1 Tax=unclassified Bartonella TaxID=2645622 RepID=UPI0021C61923|nr:MULTISPECIES: pyruvate kinase [unclassified Bartonella]UXM95564.1 pyruvate kinase [Bartonella sp. HY329]UXN09889.1 pyruvate kinase [Bartonella sp. HY328]